MNTTIACLNMQHAYHALSQKLSSKDTTQIDFVPLEAELQTLSQRALLLTDECASLRLDLERLHSYYQGLLQRARDKDDRQALCELYLHLDQLACAWQ